MSNFYFTGFADEIDPNIETQFQYLNQWGITHFDPRGIDGTNISDLNDEELARLKMSMKEHGIQVACIGSPIGKIGIRDDFEVHLQQLRRVIQIAKELGTKYIRIFSFYIPEKENPENYWEEVKARMVRMTELAENEDVILLHENEKGIYGSTGKTCLRIFQEVQSSHLQCIFDPANFIQCGQDTKEAYEMLKPYITYMHIKDANADGEVVPSGYGIGNVEWILRELYQNGYEGYLSLEPHLGSFRGLENLELDEHMTLLPGSTPEKYKLAYDALRTITDRIQNMKDTEVQKGCSEETTERDIKNQKNSSEKETEKDTENQKNSSEEKTIKENQKMEKVYMGVVGFGNMGSSHCKNIFEGKIENMELAGICDILPERLELARKLYPNVPLFSTAEEMFASGKINAVEIAVPHYDHPTIAENAFAHGIHVLVEKPAGVYTKQVLEMNEAAEKSGLTFGIMYNQRTNPVYQKVKELVENGSLGHIKRINWIITDWYRPQAYHDSGAWRSTWKTEGGGTLINQNPHQLDLWQWMFGMPDRVMSHVSFGKYYNIEVEDDVTAYLEYENGTTGVYITSTGEAPGTNRLEIACDMGRLVVEHNRLLFDRNVVSEREYNAKNTGSFARPECWKCEIPVDTSGGLQHVGILRNYKDALLKGTPLLAPGEEGVKGLTISNAIHYSAWTGKWADVKNFPHEEFYQLLQEKIRNSTVQKQDVNILSGIEGSVK